MTYNLSELQASLYVRDVVAYANNSVDGTLMTLFVVAIFFIMIMILKKYEFSKAILASSFLCFTLSIILRYAKLLPLLVVLAFLAITSLSFLWSIMENRD